MDNKTNSLLIYKKNIFAYDLKRYVNFIKIAFSRKIFPFDRN